MRILFSSMVAATIVVAAGTIGWKAEAAMTGVGTLPLQTKSYTPPKRWATTADTIVVPTAVAITAIATLIMATGTTGPMGTTGHTVITAMAGDPASPSVSDLAGAGVTKGEKKPRTLHEPGLLECPRQS